MSLNDPFRNYDAWLTTDTAGDAAEAWGEYVMEAWERWSDERDLPFDMAEVDHPEHAIYQAWEAAFLATVAYHDKLQAESEAEYYEAEHATWEADMAEWAKQQPPHA